MFFRNLRLDVTRRVFQEFATVCKFGRQHPLGVCGSYGAYADCVARQRAVEHAPSEGSYNVFRGVELRMTKDTKWSETYDREYRREVVHQCLSTQAPVTGPNLCSGFCSSHPYNDGNYLNEVRDSF